MNDKVSVIIPTCNKIPLLMRAIESVMEQTYLNIEIIVVNDGEIILNKLTKDNRLQLIQGHKTSNQALGYGSGGYTRNIGVNAATGKYICFLDDDDVFLNTKVERQVSYAHTKNARAICSDAYIGHYHHFERYIWPQTLNGYYCKELKAKLNELRLDSLPNSFTKEAMKVHNFIITSTVFIERKLFIEIGAFNNIANGGQSIDGVVHYEDWDAWLRVTDVVDFEYINEPLIFYRKNVKRALVKRMKNFIKRL